MLMESDRIYIRYLHINLGRGELREREIEREGERERETEKENKTFGLLWVGGILCI